MFIAEKTFTQIPDSNNRTPNEMECYRLLEQLGIPFVGIDHDPAATIELCLEIEKHLGCEICKNLFLCNSQKTSFYLLLMPGTKPFKTKFLSKQINSARLSFGDAEAMERLLGVTPGSVTVLALKNDKEHKIQLIIDRDLLLKPYIGCHPCKNTSTLQLKTEDILEKLLPFLRVEPVFVDLPVE